MEKADVTVIIPTLNRADSLSRTVKNLMAQPQVPAQLILVDQSTDPEIQKANRELGSLCGGITFRYLHREVPSITAARNAGLSEAQQDIVIFMDDDVDVQPDTVENIALLLSREDTALVGAMDTTWLHREKRLNPVESALGYLFLMKSFRRRKVGHVTASMLGRYPVLVRGEVPTTWAMGFCFAVKRSLAQKWNIRFDEQLLGYAYGEDLDFTHRYCIRAAKEGLRCLLSDKVSVAHLCSREYRIPAASATYRYVINREYFAYRFGKGVWNRPALWWTNVGQFFLRAVHRSHPGDILRAQRRCAQVRKYLKRGIISPVFYEDILSREKLPSLDR